VPLRLIVVDGPSAGLRYLSERAGAFLVGRSTRAQFVLPSGPGADLRVSHLHCLIETDPPLGRVHDLGSTNGTLVNGERVTSAPLNDGDEIRLGRTALRVEMDAPPDTEIAELPPHSEEHPAPAARAAVARGSLCPICGTPRTDDQLCAGCGASAAELPQPVPGYRLVRKLGEGPLGVVHLALHEAGDAAMALKTIGDAGAPRAPHLDRFVREAGVLKRLRYPHVVAVREIGLAGGMVFVASEYVRGTDAAKYLRKHGPLAAGAAVRVACQLLTALKGGHDLGFVHRDVKPANVLIRSGQGRRVVKLADYGLSRVARDARLGGHRLPGEQPGPTAFLAPELVLDSRGASPAADLYAAAATLYTLLTGATVYDQPPAAADGLAQLLAEEPVPIRERRFDLPTGLITAIHRGLARDPSRRFPDAAAFRAALKPFAG
jgi:hypothetical protein